MWNCRQVTQRASDHLERGLPWHARLQVRLHLLVCRACERYVRQMALTRDALRALKDPGPSAPSPELRGAFRQWRTERRDGVA